jgi:hypothetical protein
MQKEYVAPELKLAGEAENVILGGGFVGCDMFGEEAYLDMEFAADGEPVGKK